MRLVQELAKVAAKVLFQREQKQFLEAHKELDAVGTKITGLSWSLYKNMTAESMIEWLSIGDKFDVEKASLIVDLLGHESYLLFDEEKESESITTLMNALMLSMEMQRNSPSEQNIKTARKLLSEIENSGLPVDNYRLEVIKEKLA